jgi:hypothetical protein
MRAIGARHVMRLDAPRRRAVEDFGGDRIARFDPAHVFHRFLDDLEELGVLAVLVDLELDQHRVERQRGHDVAQRHMQAHRVAVLAESEIRPLHLEDGVIE